jgi:hypothetical protein
MALHAATDPQVTALRALLLGGLNAMLTPTTTEDVVVATYGYPAFGAPGAAPTRVPQLRLPGLAVYRLTDRFAERAMLRRETEVIMRLDYVVSATPLGSVDARWPILRAVWDACLDLIAAGHHASVSSDAHVLEAVGFTERLMLDARYPTVTYAAPSAADGVYPSFRADLKMMHRDDVDISALDDVSLQTEVYAIDLPVDEHMAIDGTGDTFASEVHE